MKARLIMSIGALALAALAGGLAGAVLDGFGSRDPPAALALVSGIVLLAAGLGALAWRGAGQWNAAEPVDAPALRYRLYWENSDESLFAVHVEPDGRFIYEGMNPAHERRLGLRSDAITGREPHQCLDPSLADQVVARFRQCIEAGAPIRYQQAYEFAGLPELILQMTLVPVWNAGHDQVIALLGSGHDVSELHRQKREIEDAHRLFERIVEASPDIVSVDRYRGPNLYVNDQAQRILGYSGDEIRALGAGFPRDLTHPDDYPAIERGLTALSRAADHELVACEYRMRTKAGEWRWLSSRHQVFRRDAGGAVTEIIGVAADTTGHRQALADLQASESRFRLVADTIPDMLYLLDTSDGSFFINRSFQDFVGAPSGMSCEALRQWVVHPDDLDRLAASQRETSGEFRHELRIRRADGEYVWFSNKGRIVRGQNGEIERLFGVAINIHDLKAAEEAARTAKERLEATLFAVGDCFIGLDPTLRITEVSGPATEWFGVPEAHLRGQKYFEILGRRDAFAKTIELAVARQQPARVARRSAFIADRWIELNVYPSAKGIGILFHDITDRKLAEQQRQEQTAFLQSTIDALSAAVVIIDHDGLIIAVNRAWRVMGRDHGATSRASGPKHDYLTTWIGGAASLDPESSLQLQVADILAGRNERFEAVLKLAQQPQWLLVKATRFVAGSGEHIVIAHEDVTGIFRRDAELRALSAQLLETQDAERRRIARELHDSTAQHLIGIQLGLAQLRDKLPADERTRSVMDDIRTALKDAQQEVRVLSYLLHPPSLEHGDLMSALDRFVAGYSVRTGLAVDFRTNARVIKLPEDVAITMMRITQEALANVLKHAGASKAFVRLRDHGARLVLDILDDGIGIPFDPQAQAPAGLGVGLPGMRARVDQLGGKLTIRGRAGKGTMVRAIIPIERRPN
ncbi:MAG: PAS domain S-box protein [Rhizobiales bacterium]|nr:PAS domain S-box protein [Hyphomicrobiales bacterium]